MIRQIPKRLVKEFDAFFWSYTIVFSGVGGNGHAYLLVTEPAPFSRAFSGAASYHWTGAGTGYLATITSAAEQGFIISYLNATNATLSNATYISFWIGGQKSDPNATNWFWINGKDAICCVFV